MEVRNCRSCGKLFNYTGRGICPSCVRKLEDKFVDVKEYIRNNPNASIAEVSEENEVSINQIKNWIREERLILSKESNIGVECERCGKLIRTGRICEACKKKVTNDLEGVSKANKKPEPEKKIQSSKENKMRFLNQEKQTDPLKPRKTK